LSRADARSARRIRFRGEVESRHEADDLLEAAGDAVLVHRGRPRSLVLACPDGCGSVLTVNLDRRVGRAWRLYRDRRGLTVYPSVWRDTGCGSHFIVSRDRLVWCGRRGQPDLDFFGGAGLDAAVLGALGDQPRSVDELADLVDGEPWEIIPAADRLVAAGKARATALGGERRYARALANPERDALAPRALSKPNPWRWLKGLFRRR